MIDLGAASEKTKGKNGPEDEGGSADPNRHD